MKYTAGELIVLNAEGEYEIPSSTEDRQCFLGNYGGFPMYLPKEHCDGVFPIAKIYELDGIHLKVYENEASSVNNEAHCLSYSAIEKNSSIFNSMDFILN